MRDRRDEPTTRRLGHDQAWELLPWLVNDTLGAEERRAVEAHVAGCAECRAEVEQCRNLGEQVRGASVSPSPHPAQLQGLLRRIDEGERGRRWPQPFAGHPRFVRGALLAQAAVIVILLALAFWPGLDRQQPAQFRTLSDAPAAAIATHQIRVVFRPDATEEQIRHLLLEVRGELAGGPSALGAYTVAVPAAGPGAEPLSAVLAQLRADARVRLAEPVAGDPVASGTAAR